jgi:hypothetical protein
MKSKETEYLIKYRFVPVKLKVKFYKTSKYSPKGNLKFIRVGKVKVFSGKSYAAATNAVSDYARSKGYWYSVFEEKVEATGWKKIKKQC